MLALVLAAIVLFTMGLIALSFPVGIYTVFYTSLSETFKATTAVQSIYIFIGPFLQLIPFPGTVGTVVLGASAIYALMFVLAGYQGVNVVKALRNVERDGFAAFFSNPLLVTILSIGFLSFTVLVIDTIETSGGVPIGSLSGDAMNIFASLVIAPLREELGFRVLIIGLVALIVSVGRPAGPTLRTLWRPSAAYEGVQNLTLPWVAIGFALAASSIIFGLAHITSGSGWEIGKLPEAAYAGVVLGYLYIRYGFHVAVLVHWGIDYFGSVFSFFGQGVYGIPWTAENPYVLQQVVNVDVLIVLGIASLLVVAYVGLRKHLVSRQQDALGLEA